MNTVRYMGLIAAVLLSAGTAQAASTSSAAPKAAMSVSAVVLEHCTVSNESGRQAANVSCEHHSAYTVLDRRVSSNVDVLPQQNIAGGVVTIVY